MNSQESKKKRVIALGFFDGIHLGHAMLLKRVNEIAERDNLIPSVMTFDAHPRSLIRGNPIPLINSTNDRTWLINRLFNIDDVIMLHFDKETGNISAEDFIEHLVNVFGARHLIAGHDFRFGSGAVGDRNLLTQECERRGIGCDIIQEVTLEGKTVSSSLVRRLIADGEIEKANKFLGHPHVLTDVVGYGFRLGRKLGTPTINMCFPDGVLIPAYGVYASKVYLEDECEYIGVTNIGVRPTVDNSGEVTAETHIMNLNKNLYGHQVRVEFHTLLRPETKFSGVDELKEQIHRDCIAAMDYFNKLC
jgi:riboflavin kinase/FMN adenylyltransferase